MYGDAKPLRGGERSLQALRISPHDVQQDLMQVPAEGQIPAEGKEIVYEIKNRLLLLVGCRSIVSDRHLC
jgi:hypothetical protein